MNEETDKKETANETYARIAAALRSDPGVRYRVELSDLRGTSGLIKAVGVIRALRRVGLRVTCHGAYDHVYICEEVHLPSEPREPDYISREDFLFSEIAKLGYHTQTRQDCLYADPDDFIQDALSEGELTPELHKQLLWVMATYADVIDWPYQGEFAQQHGYAGTLASIRGEAGV